MHELYLMYIMAYFLEKVNPSGRAVHWPTISGPLIIRFWTEAKSWFLPLRASARELLRMTKPSTEFPTIAGKKTQLTIGGSGPSLLYLHSAGGETEWMPFHEQLARHFTVYLPAHPGFADSKGLEQVRDIYDYAWHYVDLIQELKLGSVPIVGFSLGAWTAIELAILRPQLVKKMVLAAPAGVRVPEAPMGELFIDNLTKLRQLLFYDQND